MDKNMLLDDEDQMRDVINANTRRWWRLYKVYLIGCAVVVVLGVAVAAGADTLNAAFNPSGSTVDQARLEKQIKTWAIKQSGGYQLINVHCPSDVPVKAGTDFHCLVSDDHKTLIRVTVTVENDKGEVTWVAG